MYFDCWKFFLQLKSSHYITLFSNIVRHPGDFLLICDFTKIALKHFFIINQNWLFQDNECMDLVVHILKYLSTTFFFLIGLPLITNLLILFDIFILNRTNIFLKKIQLLIYWFIIPFTFVQPTIYNTS